MFFPSLFPKSLYLNRRTTQIALWLIKSRGWKSYTRSSQPITRLCFQLTEKQKRNWFPFHYNCSFQQCDKLRYHDKMELLNSNVFKHWKCIWFYSIHFLKYLHYSQHFYLNTGNFITAKALVSGFSVHFTNTVCPYQQEKKK